MHSLASFFAFLFIAASTIDADVLPETLNVLTKRDDFEWGVIGDSYASGDAYTYSNVWDNNKDECLCNTEAYGPQLEGDDTWKNDTKSSFNFPACSGKKLEDMRGQISNAGSSPSLVVMTAGGNNANFFKVADGCIFHSNWSMDYGAIYVDDTARTGACAQAIDASKAIITGTMDKDLKNTLDDLLVADNVKLNPDFLLYVTGYAAFFNPKDDWCNHHSFGITSFPPLSNALRSDINTLVTQLNTVYQNTIQNHPSKKVRFVLIDASFDGHRFCEAGSNTWNQYYSSDVWFWNVSPPGLVVPQDANDSVIQINVQSALKESGLTLYSGNGSSIPVAWTLRPLHPKISGHIAIKNAIISQMKADNIPASGPPPTPPAYATGTCSFHVVEWQDCASNSQNLFANITMYDNDKNTIGQTPSTDNSGDPIDDSKPYSFTSKLPNPMRVTGEHQHDYIQFNIGDLAFTSRTTTGPATCKNGGWDPRDGPSCNHRYSSNTNAVCNLFPLYYRTI